MLKAEAPVTGRKKKRRALSSTGLFLFFFFFPSHCLCCNLPLLPPPPTPCRHYFRQCFRRRSRFHSRVFARICHCVSARGPGDSAASLGKKQLRVSSCTPPPPHSFPAATHTRAVTGRGGGQHTCNERDSLGKDAPDAIRAAPLPESELLQHTQLHGVSYQCSSF